MNTYHLYCAQTDKDYFTFIGVEFARTPLEAVENYGAKSSRTRLWIVHDVEVDRQYVIEETKETKLITHDNR